MKNSSNRFKPGIFLSVTVIAAVSLLAVWALFARLVYTVQTDALTQAGTKLMQTAEAELTATMESIGAKPDDEYLPGEKLYLMQSAVNKFNSTLAEAGTDMITGYALIADSNGEPVCYTCNALSFPYFENGVLAGYATVFSKDANIFTMKNELAFLQEVSFVGTLEENGIFYPAKSLRTVYKVLGENADARWNLDEYDYLLTIAEPEDIIKVVEFSSWYGNETPTSVTLEVDPDHPYAYREEKKLYSEDVQPIIESGFAEWGSDHIFQKDLIGMTCSSTDTTFYMEGHGQYQLMTGIWYDFEAFSIKSLTPVFCLTLALVLIFLVFFGWFVSSRIVWPLNAVNDDFVRRNRLTRVTGSHRFLREIDELAENFNTYQAELGDEHDEIQRLKKALTYAQEAEQSRRHTSSAVAHELKTPLAVIHGYAEAMGDDISQQEREKYLETILKESEAMDELVNDMLDISRLEAGKTKLEKETFSLRELTEEIFAKLDSSMKKQSLTLTINGNSNIMAFADRGRIGQVITNYATNAIRHAPAGSTIAVTISQTYGQAIFRMKNSGEPIANEKLPKLWDAYYQADENGGSAGLGLSICKNIIDLHGGTVDAKNSADGVEFSFRISSQVMTSSARASHSGEAEPVVWTARLDEAPLAKKHGKGDIAMLLLKIVAGVTSVMLVFTAFEYLPSNIFVPFIWLLVAAVGIITLMAVINQQKLRKMSRSALVTEGDTVTLVTYKIQNDETTCETLIGSMNVSMKNGGINSEDLLGFNLGNSGRKKGSKAYNSAVLAMQDKDFVLDKYRSGYGQVELTRRYDCTLEIQGDKLVIKGAKEPGGEISGWTVPDVFGPVEI